MVLHAWLFAAPSAYHIAAYHARQHAHHARQGHDRRPSSRAFRYPSDSPRPRRTTDATSQSAYSFAQHPQYELGALVAFMAALASNSLPNTIDPAAHIVPELVLGFDTRAGDSKVQEEVETIVQDTWARNPVVIFSELRSTAAPASREVKTILETFRLYPEPTVFEVDQRVDADVLRPLLRRLTGAESLPAVLINGQPLRSLAEVRTARDDGRLRQMLDASGATVDGALNKKKKHY
ncbi:hypothetical protein AURDEDRAFT_55498 [Auricularia subglabra TFB-10046 SS5]|nr:hypothetical protein AURDEDRAFT_55498 [Auricularia subglabra TFB-10046 SS5]